MIIAVASPLYLPYLVKTQGLIERADYRFKDIDQDWNLLMDIYLFCEHDLKYPKEEILEIQYYLN